YMSMTEEEAKKMIMKEGGKYVAEEGILERPSYFKEGAFGSPQIDLTEPGGFEAYAKAYETPKTEIKEEESFFLPKQNVVEEVKRPGGIEGIQFDIQKMRDISRVQDKGLKREIKGFGLGAASSATGFLDFGVFGVKALTDPDQAIKDIIQGVIIFGKKGGFPEVGRTIKQEPGYSTGFVVSEVAQDILLGKMASKFADIADIGRTRASLKFTPVTKTDYFTKTLSVPSKTTGDVINIKFAGSVKSISEDISTQASLAGQKVDAVSAARNLFGELKFKPKKGENIFGTKVVVDKPLLTPTSPPIERSLFADPRGRVRVSRLGVLDEPKKASFIDYAVGDVTFKRNKPQILLFEQAQIEKFPKNLLDVKTKLQTGQTLTSDELTKLQKFQLTPSGQFKPLGFISKEPEITLAPGELVKKESLAGVTLINKKRVEIIRAGISQDFSKNLKDLAKKSTIQGLDAKEFSKFTALATKETGISYAPQTKKFISPLSISSPLLSKTKFFGVSQKQTKIPEITSPVIIYKISSKPEYKPKMDHSLSGFSSKMSKILSPTKSSIKPPTSPDSLIRAPKYPRKPKASPAPFFPKRKRRPPKIKIPRPKQIIKTKPTRKRKPITISRVPSLWAAGEKITAPKQLKSERLLGGLTLRPIISKKKKKKKRKSVFKPTRKWGIK
ncbi:MAG: hypothetical protein ACOC5T_01735, partial [Elusimicrobiota bacterium]